MASRQVDFAVFGSSPLAGMLAGLLASAHGRQVCVIGEPHSPFRLARDFDLSVAPLTRPESWALLRQVEPEALRLLVEIGGKAAVERIDPIFIGEAAATADALRHMQHMASGFGMSVDRLAGETLPHEGAEFRLRNAALANGTVLGPALEAWLDRMAIPRIAPDEAKVTLRRDGSARIESGSGLVEAAQTVLASDDAILDHLDPEDREPLLVDNAVTTILGVPMRPIARPYLHFLDRGVVLGRLGHDGLAALVVGSPDDAEARLGSCLAGYGGLRRAGSAVFRRVTTTDGAPFIGRGRGRKALVVAGLSPIGVFLAPALARFIAGAAEGDEAAYFSARGPARGRSRDAVAEFRVTPARGTQP